MIRDCIKSVFYFLLLLVLFICLTYLYSQAVDQSGYERTFFHH